MTQIETQNSASWAALNCGARQKAKHSLSCAVARWGCARIGGTDRLSAVGGGQAARARLREWPNPKFGTTSSSEAVLVGAFLFTFSLVFHHEGRRSFHASSRPLAPCRPRTPSHDASPTHTPRARAASPLLAPPRRARPFTLTRARLLSRPPRRLSPSPPSWAPSPPPPPAASPLPGRDRSGR